MSTPLFRAIPMDAGAVSGTAHLRPIRWGLLTAFLALSVIAAGSYAATASYARKQATTGVLAPDAGTVHVGTPKPGILTSLSVTNGQAVAAGERLFTVDFRQSLESGGTLDEAVRAALAREETLLRDQLATEETRATSEQARLDSRIAGLNAELQAMGSQRGLLEQRARVALDRMTSVTDLRRRGLISENDYRSRKDAWLAHRQELAALDQHMTATAHEVQQARLQRDSLPDESADRLGKLRAGSANIQQRVAEAQAQGAQIVRAPVAGRVTALQGTLGLHVDPAKPVLAIVPEGAVIRAELFVPSRAIGFVRAGQTVRLMYDAFPFQRFGTYRGVVESVSESVLTPDEVIGPVHLQEPSYRAAVRLERPTVTAFGREVALQPDMTVRADIMLEQRSLLEWLLEPLLSARGRM